MTRAGVTVNTTEVDRRIGKLENAYGPKGLRELIQFSAQLIDRDTQSAFTKSADPNTGRAWRPPRFPQPNPLLDRTGTLRRLTYSRVKVGRVRAWAKHLVREGTKLVSYQRRSVMRRGLGRSIGDYVGIGLLHQYGRRGHRPLPKRQFAGITKVSRRRVVAAARRQSDRARTG